jgi:Mce-associated membrane protein
MIRLKSRRAADRRDLGAAAETPAAPMQLVIVEDEAVEAENGMRPRSFEDAAPVEKRRTAGRVPRLIGYALLPGLALLLASAAGYLKWQDASLREAAIARAESVRAATDGTIALLSYRPDTVQKDLETARGALTGAFLDSYTKLTHEVVIPGAKQKQISAVATVPGAASKSATANHAVVLVFVNQTVIVGQDAPTNSASSARVTLDRIGGRWLISGFDPV